MNYNPIEAKKIIDRQLEKLRSISVGRDTLINWRATTVRLLTDVVDTSELTNLERINSTSWESDAALFEEFMVELRKDVEELPEHYLISSSESPYNFFPADNGDHQPAQHGSKVFVIHGHDTVSKLDVSRTVEKLGLEAIVLHEQPNVGATIIEKFETHAAEVGFAIAILTPDDEGHPINKADEKKARARQNVVLELGYFAGKLGRSRVCVLYKGDVEIPSDYLGVLYVPLDDVGGWRFTLAKEMKASGLEIDLNALV